MSEDIPLQQAPSDEELFIIFQKAMFDSAVKTIAAKAPGLPFAVLHDYMRQIGGDAIDVTKHVTRDQNPFRARCKVVERMKTGPNNLLVPVEYVEKVVGWG